MRVHRLAYMLHHKEWELPPDMHCSHLCHNSLCINVNHLILETPFVNGNRRQCARENICLGHDQAPPCIFFLNTHTFQEYEVIKLIAISMYLPLHKSFISLHFF